MAKYHIFTDGSARFNPGPGGWGMIVMNEEDTEIFFTASDTDELTTNNRMELKAMICAFEYVENHPHDSFIIYSDSTYVVNSVNSWICGWAANGWKNSKKQTVENLDCMQMLHSYLTREFFNAEVKKCSGHSGDIGNELADAIATQNWKKFGEIAEAWDIINHEREYQEIELAEAGENWFPID